MGEAPWMGAAGGIMAAEQSMAQEALLPDRIRFGRARADIEENQAAAQKRMSAMMSGMNMDAMANPIWGMAEAAFKANLPDAYKYANTASLVDYRRQAGKTAELKGVEAANKIKLERLDLKARLLSGVRDDASLQAAARDYESQTGESSGLLDRNGNLLVPYSPELVGRERAKAISAKDQTIMDWRNRMEERRRAEDKSKQDNRTFWQNMEHQEDRARAQQRGRLESQGGSALFPTNAQITIGAEYLGNKFNVDTKEPWARVMGRELIDEAKRLRQLNPALSATEAIDSAFNSLDKKGVFSAHRQTKKQDDETLNEPMPLPASGDTADLIEGQVYSNGTEMRRWSKQGWVTWTGKGWETNKRPVTSISQEDAVRALGITLDPEADPGNEGEEDDDE